MNRSPVHSRFAAARRHLLVALAGFGCTLPALAGVSLPNTPLQSGSTVPPNIMVVIDDSGSMFWRFLYVHNSDGSFPSISLPAGVDGNSRASVSSHTGNEMSTDNFGGCNLCVVTGDGSGSNTGNNQTKYMLDKTYALNGLYYNPKVIYSPWKYPDGTSAPNVPYTSASRDHVNATYSYTGPGGASISTTSGSDVDLSNYIHTYYVPKANNVDLTDATNYYRYQILKDGTIWRSELAAAGSGGTTGKGCNDTASAGLDWRICTQTTGTARNEVGERQNFANWFSYYQTRIKTAKGGLSAAFSALGTVPRVGFRTIWDRNNKDIPVGIDDGLFEDKGGATPVNNKTNWFSAVINAIANNGTPLRSALASAGNYYKNTSSTGPYGPESGADQLSCRQNFTIMTTDGFWNNAYNDATVGTADNGAGYPFASSVSQTLADIAYYYWETDLRPDLANKVPSSTADPATWQHMTTFTISIGAQGTLDPVQTLADIAANVAFTWPTPLHDQVTTIDDLFHAAVNGHGKFVRATDPTSFVSALNGALAAIAERTSSSSNVSVSGARLATTTQLFQSSFVIGKWTGDLGAYAISTSGVVSTTPSWLASQQMPAWNARKVYTWNGSAGATFPTGAQSTTLGGSLIVNYLLGNTAHEQRFGGTYRNRNSILGDMVDSSPVYVPSDTTVTPNTPAMVYVGGNDGMLHAFDAATGAERFAYVPGGLNFGNVATLANPSYVHQFFVDGALVVSTKDQTKTASDTVGKNILVGVLGRGGNTVYALDVTSPAGFNASKVMWEFSDPDMGNSLGTPIITRANNGDPAVIISNGYNSASGHSIFYVLNIRTGALIAKLDTKAGDTGANSNGMATPKGWDEDRNGTIDVLYGGDLLGNVWEYDVSDSNPSNWGPVFGTTAAPQPLYVAKDASGNRQPITSGFSIGLDPATFERWVFFGTGRYLSNGDPTDKSVQTWYGIVDDGSQVASVTTRNSTVLKQRSIVVKTTVNGTTVRAFEAATSGDMAGLKGWYVDLQDPTPRGERIVSDSVLLGNALLAASIIPSNDACDFGGSGFINALDAFTGGALSSPFFDINGDGSVDSGDTVTGPSGGQLAAGSIDLGVGMPSLPAFVEKVIAATGSSGNLGQVIVSTPTNAGRISWREVLIGN